MDDTALVVVAVWEDVVFLFLLLLGVHGVFVFFIYAFFI